MLHFVLSLNVPFACLLIDAEKMPIFCFSVKKTIVICKNLFLNFLTFIIVIFAR